MAPRKVKGNLKRILEKERTDLVRGIRSKKNNEKNKQNKKFDNRERESSRSIEEFSKDKAEYHEAPGIVTPSKEPGFSLAQTELTSSAAISSSTKYAESREDKKEVESKLNSHDLSPFISESLDNYLKSATLNISFLLKANPNIIPLDKDEKVLSVGKLKWKEKSDNCQIRGHLDPHRVLNIELDKPLNNVGTPFYFPATNSLNNWEASKVKKHWSRKDSHKEKNKQNKKFDNRERESSRSIEEFSKDKAEYHEAPGIVTPSKEPGFSLAQTPLTSSAATIFNSHPRSSYPSYILSTRDLYQQDNNAAYSDLFRKRCKIVMELAQKRKAQAESVKIPTQAQKNHELPDSFRSVLNKYCINYDEPLSPMEIANNRQERIQREKQKNQAAGQVQFVKANLQSGSTASVTLAKSLTTSIMVNTTPGAAAGTFATITKALDQAGVSSISAQGAVQNQNNIAF